MALTRVAIIGLSSSTANSWSSFAHLPYLLSPQGRLRYSIAALCNSSVSAARNAIKKYNLDPATKAYGSPEDLAKDKDIDLIVCCTRVDKHYDTILPSVKAGQNVFVEWPLANGLTEVEDLVEQAKKSGSRTIIGLQSRYAPIVHKVRELLSQGRVGKLVSSEVLSDGGETFYRSHVAPKMLYLTDLSLGGNFFHIGLGHLLDEVEFVLGDIQDVRSRLHTQHPTVEVRDRQTRKVLDTVQTNVPDLILLNGTLSPSDFVNQGATVHVRFRSGNPFPGEPSLTWLFTGDKGEILIRAEKDSTLGQFAYDGPVTVQVRDFATNKVEEVAWEWEGWQKELPMPAWNVGAGYEAYAKGDDIPSFDVALKRHQELDAILANWEGGKNRSL
ncbi:uncharacterized protein J7T54_003670 [Emericellopsis cladophorae]|uniref:Gfo/Idh/MocA-like oxidoreductase N-terminal domain-containing protein n=1 Tax=Emericellopsis cladophorae TaxID=2686198 RepID=A0A9Q0BE83_9HYPO|nr:uncharacterized protein J7T54_003670 [Emericellopsis cladophorae]KAI6782657.1 hypothetical protein J7T54_003670 [Emericellopsis cladophorae]